MKYLSIKEVSEKWGISTRCIQILCKKGRILDIILIGRTAAAVMVTGQFGNSPQWKRKRQSRSGSWRRRW